MDDHLARRAINRRQQQIRRVLLDPFGRTSTRLFGPGLVLEEADRHDHAVSGMHGIIGNESGDSADNGHKALLDFPFYLVQRAESGLPSSYRSVHTSLLLLET